MAYIKKYITIRRLSLSLILVMAGMLYISTLIPQHLDSTPDKISAWRQAHEQLLWLIDGAGLHRIFTQSWFAVTTLLAAVLLSVTSYDQFRGTRKKMYSTAIGSSTNDLQRTVQQSRLHDVARCHHYSYLKTGSCDQLKFVRHRWGYFGNSLLHIGMVLVVFASLYVALTQRQGTLILVAGDQPHEGEAWTGSEHGILTTPLTLPGVVQLGKVRVKFDDKNQPSEVSSEITISDHSGKIESFTATINRISGYHGLRVYHAAQFGDSFALEFIDAKGDTHFEKIPIQQPGNLTKAGYGDFDLKWSPYLLSAKYFADRDHRTMTSTNPLLVMRLLDKNREVGRVNLTPGVSGVLGEYRVRLLGVQKWSKLIFVDVTGIPMIFAGFTIIMLGGLLHYLTPPRELIAIRQQDGRYRVFWRATTFSDFFIEERDRLATALQKEMT